MKIRGITVTGNSRHEAEEAYRAVATGKSVTAYADANNEFVILCSGETEITPFNPLTGDADMVEAGSKVIDQIEFQSESSDNVQQTNYVVCSSGCGAHVISDDVETRFCPACAESLPDDDCPDCDEQSQNTVQASAIESQQILVAATSLDEAIDAFRAIASSGATTARACGDIAVATNLDEDGFRFSPFLGDENVGTVTVAMAAVASADSEEKVAVHHFECMNDECGLHVVASTDDPVFCPSCSSGLIEPADQTSLSGDDEEEDLDDIDDMEEETEESEDDSDEESEDDMDEEESEESEETEEEDLEDMDEEDEESLSAATVTTKVDTVAVGRPMLVCVAGAEPAANKLHAAYAGVIKGQKTVVAFYDGTPVAVANSESSPEFADMLDSPNFGRALCSAAGEIGVGPALNQMGFVDIKPEVEVESIVQQQVAEQIEAQVSQVRAAAETESKDLSNRMTAALATAAQGINSGFFKDTNNPVISALASALTSIGMQGAEQLVRNVFAEHNDAYIRNMIAKASQIMNYDLQVQNELAEVVAGTAPAKETLPIGKPVQIAAPQQQQPVQEQEATASSDNFQSVLDTALLSLGKRR